MDWIVRGTDRLVCSALHPRQKNIASSLRLLRNSIHTDELIPVPSALEAIRHAAIVLNAVFPFGGGSYRATLMCAHCQKATDFDVPADELFYGNVVGYTCPGCSFSNTQTVLP